MPELKARVLFMYIFKLLARQLIWVISVYIIYIEFKVIFII